MGIVKIWYREYDAATPDDLYYSLQIKIEEAGKTNLLGGYNVSTILKSWDSFKGYPVVDIKRNYENGVLTLNQVNLQVITLFSFVSIHNFNK